VAARNTESVNVPKTAMLLPQTYPNIAMIAEYWDI
jgi:hypothetical protein